MKDIVILNEAHREAMGSPERAQQSMKKWRAWMKDMEDNGHLKSFGQPLERAGKVVGGKKKTVTDGPYAETKDVIGGYSVKSTTQPRCAPPDS